MCISFHSDVNARKMSPRSAQPHHASSYSASTVHDTPVLASSGHAARDQAYEISRATEEDIKRRAARELAERDKAVLHGSDPTRSRLGKFTHDATLSWSVNAAKSRWLQTLKQRPLLTLSAPWCPVVERAKVLRSTWPSTLSRRQRAV